nr:hypothetical protein StreXyl84_22560 [Streptomyces sp. Xyl84]
MNEGKPQKSTRPNWWSRPRQAPGAPDASEGQDAQGTPEVPAATSAAPPAAVPAPEPTAPAVAPVHHEGDYELERPATPQRDILPATPGTPVPSEEPAPPGPAPTPDGPTAPGSSGALDELAAPGALAAPGSLAVPEPSGALDKPEVLDGPTAPGAPAAPGSSSVPEPPVPLDKPTVFDGPAVPGAPAAPGSSATLDELSAPGSSTVPEPPAASGPFAVPGAPGPAGPAAQRPRPLHDPDPYSTPPYGEPGPWAPAPPVQHPAALTPPPPAGAPVPAPGPVPPAVPAPAAYAAVLPDPAVPADVLPQGIAPADVPPPPAPATAPPGGADPAAAPSGAGAPAPQEAAGLAGAVDPWQRYDPWAVRPAAGPLLESGAGAVSGERRRGRVRRSLVGGAVLLALVAGVAGVAGGVAGAYLERNGGFGTVELPQAGKEPAGRAPDSVAGIAARALPSVVTLHVSGSGEQDTGTGFVLDRLGHILTNNHVVGPAASGGDISVTFNGGQTARGTIVGRDTGYDLAVVQVRGVRGLTPMPLGNSDNVRVGDPVVAIGAPFDLADTVTSGIISAKERPITAGGEKGDGSDLSYVDALQTDAPINPGNSGGPLLDSRGRVVGINSAIRSADTGSDVQTGQAGSIGLGFAIPVNQAKRVAEELINTGRASHPVIGVTLDMAYPGDGAKVGDKAKGGGSPVTPGGPGAKAGIRAGDVITAVDGVPVHSGEELIVRTRAHRPGDRLDLTVERGGQKRRVTLVLGSSDSG